MLQVCRAFGKWCCRLLLGHVNLAATRATLEVALMAQIVRSITFNFSGVARIQRNFVSSQNENSNPTSASRCDRVEPSP
ncbi:hypothetical protein EV363DRAFT_1375314 [Boletus edulis]|nr:hypothetical protein EV363DRAFT_1375314 [Boletus edulis]